MNMRTWKMKCSPFNAQKCIIQKHFSSMDFFDARFSTKSMPRSAVEACATVLMWRFSASSLQACQSFYRALLRPFLTLEQFRSLVVFRRVGAGCIKSSGTWWKLVEIWIASWNLNRESLGALNWPASTCPIVDLYGLLFGSQNQGRVIQICGGELLDMWLWIDSGASETAKRLKVFSPLLSLLYSMAMQKWISLGLSNYEESYVAFSSNDSCP